MFVSPALMLVMVLVITVVASAMIGAVPPRERFTNQTSMINNGLPARGQRHAHPHPPHFHYPRFKPTPLPVPIPRRDAKKQNKNGTRAMTQTHPLLAQPPNVVSFQPSHGK